MGSQAKAAMRGLWAFATFDRRGADFIDPTIEGCARSFWVYVAALPIYIFVISFQPAHCSAAQDCAVPIAARIIGYAIECAGFPLLMVPALRWLGRAAKWPQLVTAYNWLQVSLLAVTSLLIGLRLLGMSESASGPLWLFFGTFSLLVEGFMFEAILQSGFIAAAALVLTDIVFNESVDAIARSLH